VEHILESAYQSRSARRPAARILGKATCLLLVCLAVVRVILRDCGFPVVAHAGTAGIEWGSGVAVGRRAYRLARDGDIMTVRVKVIKPGPFKSDAIFRRLKGVAERTTKLAEKEFGKAYKTWKHKPKPHRMVKVTGQGITWEVWFTDQIFAWVSEGTKGPYKIPKAGPGLLVFPSGYKAKTTPNVLFSKSGGSYGSTVFVSGQVTHPGIKPRNFDKAVMKYVTPWYVKWNADAIKVGARESGHSI